MAELLIKTVRELPNGNILLEKHLFFLSESDIIELRKKTNWVKGSKGLFAGSVSNGAGGSARMSKQERTRVSSAIATNFPNLKANGKKRSFCYGNYKYEFSVIEFGTYTFYNKEKID